MNRRLAVSLLCFAVICLQLSGSVMASTSSYTDPATFGQFGTVLDLYGSTISTDNSTWRTSILPAWTLNSTAQYFNVTFYILKNSTLDWAVVEIPVPDCYMGMDVYAYNGTWNLMTGNGNYSLSVPYNTSTATPVYDWGTLGLTNGSGSNGVNRRVELAVNMTANQSLEVQIQVYYTTVPAVGFDGVNDYVGFTTSGAMAGILSQYTISSWFTEYRFQYASTHYGGLGERSVYNTAGNIAIDLYSGQGLYYDVKFVTAGWKGTGTTLILNEYHPFMATAIYDGTTVSEYLNTTQYNPQSISGDTVAASSAFNIGKENGFFATGALTQTNFYTAGLNSSQISSLYAGTYTNTTGLTLLINASSFSGSSNTTVVDFSGSANTGTAYGNVQYKVWAGSGFQFTISSTTMANLTLNYSPDVLTQISAGNTFQVNFTFNGSGCTLYDSGAILGIPADANTNVTIAGESNSSNATSIWALNSGFAATIFNASTGGSFSYYYYQLLIQNASAAIIGGGSPTIPFTYHTAPATSGSSWNGTTAVLNLIASNQTIWVETQYSTESAPSSIGGASGEAWNSINMTAIGGPSLPYVIYPFTYFHQYQFNLSYSISGGGTGYSAPTLVGNDYGYSTSITTLTTTSTSYWIDAGSPWSVVPNPLIGSTPPYESWTSSQTLSGTVSGTFAANFIYYHSVTGYIYVQQGAVFTSATTTLIIGADFQCNYIIMTSTSLTVVFSQPMYCTGAPYTASGNNVTVDATYPGTYTIYFWQSRPPTGGGGGGYTTPPDQGITFFFGNYTVTIPPLTPETLPFYAAFGVMLLGAIWMLAAVGGSSRKEWHGPNMLTAKRLRVRTSPQKRLAVKGRGSSKMAIKKKRTKWKRRE